jgi:uncharacterized membrane protein
MTPIVRFANVLLAALVAGTMFGIWLGFNPDGLTASAYVEQQQSAIRALNTTMPILGAICIGLTMIHALLVRSARTSSYLLCAGAVLLIAAGLVTRFGNQPINAHVITWRASAPPSTWIEARDQWWHWHVCRTIAGIAALMCIVAASIPPIAPSTTASVRPSNKV